MARRVSKRVPAIIGFAVMFGACSTSATLAPGTPLPSVVPSAATAVAATPLATVALSNYVTTSFKGPFAVSLEDGWELWVDDVNGVAFGLGPPSNETSLVQLLYLDNVAASPCSQELIPTFPTIPWTGSAADFIGWLRRSAPATVTISPTQSVVLGGARGSQVDLSFSTVAPCKFVAITQWQADNSAGLYTPNQPFRLAALDVNKATVLVWYFGQRDTFLPKADRLLSTLEFR